MLAGARSLLYGLLVLGLVLPPARGFADEKEDLQKQIDSVHGPATEGATPAPEGVQPTVDTPVDHDKTDHGRTVWTRLGEHRTLLIGASLAGAAYLLREKYLASVAIRAYRAQNAAYLKALPDGAKGRLQPHLDRISAIEERLAQRLSEIQDPKTRETLMKSSSPEVCAAALAKLSLRRMLVTPTDPATASAPSTERPANRDNDLVAEIRNEQEDFKKAYEEWRTEVEKLHEELAQVTQQTPRMPPTLEQLAKRGGDAQSQKAIRAEIDRVLEYYKGLETQYAEQAAPTTTENALAFLGKFTTPDGRTQIGSNIGETMATAWGKVTHPVRSMTEAFTGAVQGAHEAIVASPGYFAERMVPIALMGMTLAAAISYDSTINKMEADYQTKKTAIAAANTDEKSVRSESMEKLTDEAMILMATQTFRYLQDAKIIKDKSDGMPFMEKEGGLIDLSPEARATMTNLRAEAPALAKKMKITDYEALWLGLYTKQAMDASGGQKTGDELTRLQQATFEKNKRSIQALAATTSEMPKHMDEGMRQARVIIDQAKKEAEVKAAEAKAKEEAAAKAEAAKAEAASKAEAAKKPADKK